MKNNKLIKKIISLTIALVTILSLTSCAEEGVCVVKFYNDRTIIAIEKVEPNTNVQYEGETPTKPGFTFIGWDKELTDVTSNLHVHALFERNREIPEEIAELASQFEPLEVFLKSFNSLNADEVIAALGTYYIEGTTNLTDIDYQIEIENYQTLIDEIKNVMATIENIRNGEEASFEAFGESIDKIFSTISGSNLAIEIITSIDYTEGLVSSILAPNEVSYQEMREIFKTDLKNLSSIAKSIAKILSKDHEYSFSETIEDEYKNIFNCLKKMELLDQCGNESIKYIISYVLNIVTDKSVTEVLYSIAVWVDDLGINSIDEIYNDYFVGGKILDSSCVMLVDLLAVIVESADDNGLIDVVLDLTSITIDREVIDAIVENVLSINDSLQNSVIKEYTIRELLTAKIDDIIRTLNDTQDKELFNALSNAYSIFEVVYEMVNDEVFPLGKADFDIALQAVENLILNGYFQSYDEATMLLDSTILQSEIDNLFEISFLKNEGILQIVVNLVGYEIAEGDNILEVVQTPEFKTALGETANSMISLIYSSYKDYTIMDIVNNL